jgi:GH15 family glucan-1,4-alpha-glucosidase
MAGDDIDPGSFRPQVLREYALVADGERGGLIGQRPLGDAEGAFLLCGFIMALAEYQQGDELAPVRYFERNRAACGPPGLFSEEYDVTQRQLRGNLPQAFVHAMLLECAVTLGSGGV